MGKLAGKIAVITGGNSGIGLATAQRFVAEGAYVFITGRRQAELDAAVKLIGNHVTGVQGDVANLADLDRLYATVQQQKGHLDIVFANAGGGEFAPLGAITEEHFDKTFGVNVKGTLFTVQKALPLMPDGASIRAEWLHDVDQGHAGVRRLRRDQGGLAVVRADVVGRPEGAQDPRQRRQPGHGHHARLRECAGPERRADRADQSVNRRGRAAGPRRHAR